MVKKILCVGPLPKDCSQSICRLHCPHKNCCADRTPGEFMKKQILERYGRTADNQLIIDITAGKVEDLYNNFDRYTTYAKKELQPDLVDYLIESANELGKEQFVIQFRLSHALDDSLMTRVTGSVASYFLYLKELELRSLAKKIRNSLLFFFLGIIILSLAVWFNQHIAGNITVVKKVFAEGLTVAAWVSLWEALATFLVNWAPHRNRIKLYENIARSKIIFVESQANGAPPSNQ